MATSRSLGTLTIDLIAKIAGFTEGMSQAERSADRSQRKIAADAKRRSKETEKAWKDSTDKIGAILGGIGASVAGGALFSKIAIETANAQKEQNLLAAALKATGSAAGFSQSRLNEMAGSLESLTTFSAGEANQAQTVLLGFTNIAGEQLPKALERAADFAARTGVTLASAAETMGRALDVPSAGMASLQRQGFKFSESQIELARELERTGKVAEAQDIVLKALDETYGGAAVAARDTLGGAYTALQNTINSLLTGEGGSFRDLQNSVESFTLTLSSDQTRSAFAAFTSWIAEIANVAVRTAATLNDSGLWGWLSVSNKESADLQATYNEVSSTIQRLKKQRDELDPSKSTGNKINDILFGDVGDLDRQISVLEGKLKGVQSRLSQNSMPGGVAPSLAAAFTPDLTPRTIGSVNLKDGEKKTGGGKSQIERDADAAKKYLENLKQLAAGRRDLSTAEQLAYDLDAERLKLTAQQREEYGLLADQIDKRIAGEMALAQETERLNRLYAEGSSVTEQMLTPMEKYAEQVQRLNDLLSAGAISSETYARAVDKYYKDATDQSTEYTKQAAANMQTILGDWLYNGLQGSWDNILQSFVQMLLRMEAQALAANIMGALTGGATGGGGSFLGGLFSGIFGGGRAGGGGVSAGRLYEVNERGPEMLSVGGRDYLMTGSSAGFVTPNGASSVGSARGGLNITVPVSVDAGGADTNPAQARAFSEQLSRSVKATVQDEITKSSMPGGQLWAMRNGRA